MKVLIVNTSDTNGGAAKAAFRLYEALKCVNIDAQMLVKSKYNKQKDIIGPENNVRKFIAYISPFFKQIHLRKYKNRNNEIFTPGLISFSGVLKQIRQINPDIVHLHLINNSFLDIKLLSKIKQPIVWTMHDLWAVTGGCHYAGDCVKYKNRCGNCPILNSKCEKDLSYKIIKKKKKYYRQMTLIGLSKWITKCAKASILSNKYTVINLPNPIDINLYSPFCKEKSREILSLPSEKKIILFPSANPINDKRKGFDLLLQSINKLDKNEYHLILIGNSKDYEEYNISISTTYISPLKDDISLMILYNSADITAVPSLQENLSNNIMESMSCGTPVIAYNIGGNSDMIDHKKNGYLSSLSDKDDFSAGIRWVIENNQKNKLSDNARNKIVNCFNSPNVAEQYVKLYNKIIKKKTI